MGIFPVLKLLHSLVLQPNTGKDGTVPSHSMRSLQPNTT
uniref:Uncharacterized protein n=1 Tax=Arundo donax TaxID=35708 RepID=A0A0A9APZ5_ARUDO